jgi:[protein-PII] uridylyltransferase
MGLDRDTLLADQSLRGRAFCSAYSDLVDGWLARLLEAAVGVTSGVALVAVGGSGRAELSAQSDLDVLLLHDGRGDIAEVADRVWYPIWDEGLKLGHAVRTVKEAVTLAADDVDTATSLLQIRHVAGDVALTDELSEKALAQWRKRARRYLPLLAEAVTERHRRAGEIAFLLEPDLKEGRGGLRDVHALRWGEWAQRILWDGDDESLQRAYDVLLDVRVTLHRRTGRPGDVLLLQEQDAVATDCGFDDADRLMAAVASAARTIAWRSDEAWDRIGSSLHGPLGRIARRDRPLRPGIVLREGEVFVAADTDIASQPALALEAAADAATHRTRIERASLERLAASVPPMPDPWPGAARAALVQLLLAGGPAIAVMEALDQVGLFVRALPEWEPVRCRPQRNAYHRFTVDRHLCEAAVNAAELAGRVSRPDLLVVGTLLHDIGKGYPGDHTEVGVDLVGTIGTRMGFPPEDVAELVAMVRHHLLLPDVATRRDLSDDGTITLVADAVGSLQTLQLLHALTEADSLATGPAAWGSWKAELVGELVSRVAHVLGGGAVQDVTAEAFPTEEQEALLAAREEVVRGSGNELTVVAADRPGLFSRVAGVLALAGLDVVEASVHSTDDGMALEVFRVESSFGPTIAWPRIVDDVERALGGRLALQARLAERARVYGSRRPAALADIVPSVTIDNDVSADSTVVEVHAADAIGVLYRITRALADLDLDVRRAKVQTLGHEVVDAFYVRHGDGTKLTDPAVLTELERALLHALTAA